MLAEAGDLINYDYAVFYNYDIHGNVDTLLQDYGETGLLARHGNRYKRITHQYDLISGKINSLSYQPRLYDPVTAQWIIQPDAFFHHYSYDAENRLTDVYTSADETHWDHDAHYQYYKHGPLSRAVIGENQVQGIDYAYTLQGWLKGVNGTTAEEGQVARDAYNFSLHYHANDYSAINASGAYSGLSTKLEILNAYKPLFNGNISSMAVDIDRLGTPLLYNYRYDQLNRLTAMDAYKGNASDKNIWDNGLSITQDYKESISYDASGNILGYERNGWYAALPMDKLTYHYQPGNNKLDHVKDIVPAANYVEDIDDQQPGNYAYDEIGNLIQDNAEGISKIEWTVYGKLKSIVKTNAEKIVYTYDASGNRISKEVNTSGATITTMYVRDASGNTMAVYAVNSSGNRLFLNEQHLYGSNRLGIFLPGKDLSAIPPLPVNMGYGNSGSLIIFERGKKLFELSNHLGNVLATVSDKKAAHDAGNGTIDYYDADVVSAQDYYPFGMTMPGRKFDSGKYRYGFNGKENDNEVKGEGNQQDYGMRISDTRLGRFLSVDPLTRDYAFYSPYQYAGNKPIQFTDIDGLEENNTSTYLKIRAPVLPLMNKDKILPVPKVYYFEVDGRTPEQKQAAIQRAEEAKVMNRIYYSNEGWSFQIFSGIGASAFSYGEGLVVEYAVGKGLQGLRSLKNAFESASKISNAEANVFNLGNSELYTAASKSALGGSRALNSVNTPYGIAEQTLTKEAYDAINKVQNGATLYRIGTLGKSQAGEAQFWSLENPVNFLSNPEAFAAKFGMPAENLKSGQLFIEAGKLKKGASFVTRPSPGVGLNKGGAIEVVTNTNSVELETFNVIKH